MKSFYKKSKLPGVRETHWAVFKIQHGGESIFKRRKLMNAKHDALGFAKVVLFIYLLCGFTKPVLAVDRTWNGTGNQWSTAANWTPVGAPAYNDTLHILLADANVQSSSTTVSVGDGGSIEINASGASVSLGDFYCGDSGKGTLTISQGALSTGFCSLANSASDNGVATLDGFSSSWTT
jgi:hypothetical protein